MNAATSTIGALGLFNRLRPYLLLSAALLIASLCILRGIRTGEFDFVDEPDHAVTGLYFHDLLLDHPFAHPIEYTYVYYAHYPALGLIHWPPLFHFCEGIMFLLFQPSVVTARVTILLFALLTLVFWFRFVYELRGPWAATLATLFLALVPGILLYEKVVMLEMPSLALCIAATYFWSRYLRTEQRSAAYWFGVCAALALLTKQTSIYLLPFCFFTILVWRKWRLLFRPATLTALAICLVLTGPFYLAAFKLHGRTIGQDLSNAGVSGITRFTYYFQHIPDQLGWPLLALSVLGIATYRLWAKDDDAKLMILWIAAVFVTVTLLGTRVPRYSIYWIPPLIYFAVVPLTGVTALRRGVFRVVVTIVTICVLTQVIATAWLYRRPYISGYAAAAESVTQLTTSGFILFDGDLPGDFIFFVRCHDPARRFFVLRKALYATRIMPGHGESLLHTEGEIADLMANYGIRFVVVTELSRPVFPIQAMLRKVLEGSQFRLVKRFKVDTNDELWQGDNLLLYENTHPTKLAVGSMTIKMLTLPHDITVPIE